MDPPAAWGQFGADAVDLLLRLPGEADTYGQQALLHRACRMPPRVPPPLGTLVRPLRLLTLTPQAVPFYVSAWTRLGNALQAQLEEQMPDAGIATFTRDPRGGELEEALPRVQEQRPPFLLADFPREGRQQQWGASLTELGYAHHSFEFVTTWYGDRTARARVGTMSALAQTGWQLLESTPPEPLLKRAPQVKQLPLLHYTAVPADCWLPSE